MFVNQTLTGNLLQFSGVRSFNSKNGCQRCTVVGVYNRKSKTTVYAGLFCPKRTNEGFRNWQYPIHQKYESPLLSLPIDMILQFPVANRLHLLELGVQKRLLSGWCGVKKQDFHVKWTHVEVAEITEKLIRIRLPAEFHRSVRGLDELKNWKGTEFATFLHYLGTVILKDYLEYDLYQHFLHLFCAITICSSTAYTGSRFINRVC